MSKNKLLQTKFKLAFLLPKYWPTWIGVAILWSISWLPYRVQLALGRQLGKILYKIGGSRKRAAERNLELCFPEMSPEKINDTVRQNFENTGIALLEVGMGWWWPDWRVKRKMTITGLEHIENAKREGKGVLILAMHNLSIEMNCRGMGLSHPAVVFYRPHNNALMEYFQFRGRGRSNKYMLGKKDVKGLIRALRDGEASIYLPDQDYGRKTSQFLPFFAVPDAATTNGTMIFAKQPNIVTVMAIPTRNPDGTGYHLEITPPLDNFPSGDDTQDMIRINQELEKAIMKHPEQYMWMHRRFKTRPNKTDPSLYT